MAKKVEIQLGLNSRGFAAGLESATGSLGKFAKSLGSSMFGQYLGAQGVINLFSKITDAASNYAEKIKTIFNSAELFGDDKQFTQRLMQDAEEAQVPFEKLKSVFTSISEAREKALFGKDTLEYAGVFAKFGISLDMIREKNPVELFNAVRDAISGMSAEMAGAADTLTAMADLGIKGRQMALMRMPDDRGERMGVMTDAQLEKGNRVESSKHRLERFKDEVLTQIVDAALPDKGPDIAALRQTIAEGEKVGGPFAKEMVREAKRALNNALANAVVSEKQSAFTQGESDEKMRIATEEAARQWLLADEAARDADFAKGLEEHPYKAAKAAKAPHQFAYDISTDPMARMGAFIGGAANLGNPQLNVIRQQLDVQRKMESHLQKMANYWDSRTTVNPFWE